MFGADVVDGNLDSLQPGTRFNYLSSYISRLLRVLPVPDRPNPDPAREGKKSSR